MNLVTRILLSIFLIVGVGFYLMTYDILESVRIRYLESVEESLVDQAVLLSTIVASDMAEGVFSAANLHKLFDETYARKFVAQIYQLKKTGVDTRVYITDNLGFVIFDSTGKADKGTDFSQWRDVYLTLRGQYGARSSRDDPRQEESSVLYVAAQLIVGNEIIGALTVAKPTTSINHFILMARQQIIRRSILITGLVIVLSVFVIVTITKPIKILTRYANDIRDGKKAVLPKLDKSEIGDMGRAFENMREALENRKYVERYVQTLTHEIKSPVSAIKGAAELLEEEMPKEQQKIFLENIKSESERIKRLVDRMLDLSSIENMKTLTKVKTVYFHDLVKELTERLAPVLSGKQIKLVNETPEGILIEADPFLIKQAISNLIQNSVDFSSPNDRVKISAKQTDNQLVFKVEDQGPGIPEFAIKKVFEKFFSLQRPDNGKKSTGLGLNFVKEIAELHRGEVQLANLPDNKGTCATLTLPVSIEVR